jgi:hypothetical protein
LPQNSLKELEVEIQAWFYGGTSNLTLASLQAGKKIQRRIT